ncbi:ABC transporter substrate-binding protein [Paenibacillus tyrfis]|nr:extracellular solute-binding protein [Paenibacillus tyrfis]
MDIIKKVLIASSTFLCTILIISCSKDNVTKLPSGELKIMDLYYGGARGEEYFRSQYTDFYEYTYPSVKVRVLPVIDNPNNNNQLDPIQVMKDKMSDPNPPDIVMTNYDQLPLLIADNLIVPLDSLIKKDNYDISGIALPVVETMKKMGEGKIYALAPQFSTNALIYNKKIFDDAKVSYPTDDQTWDEIFVKAMHLTKNTDSKIYGFSFSFNKSNSFYSILNSYIASSGIQMVDTSSKELLVNNKFWENCWNKIQELNSNKTFPNYDDKNENEDAKSLFLKGKLAMSILQYNELQELIKEMKATKSGLDWGIAALPAHPENPNTGGTINLKGLMAINSKGNNIESAWNYLKLINGNEWAEVKSRETSFLVSRTSFIKGADNYNVKAFYKLIPSTKPLEESMLRSNINLLHVQDIGITKFNEVLQGKKIVKEALSEWQEEGNLILRNN